MFDPEDIRRRATARKTENQALLKKLARMDSRKLDDLVHSIHEEVFEEIDCLECANCCKTLGPRITESDVSRISGTLRIKPVQFLNDFLHTDEDGDLIFKTMPCPFLMADNYCSVYNDRPKACRDYPHTDRRRFYQLLPLTLKNSYICPAVLEILEKLRQKI